MQEARELANDPCTDYSAAPLEDDIFEWHCTLRGPPGTEFEGGLYHFRILLPAEYPFRPPSLMMLTPNGRFELNTKICISFTSYHEEMWQPAWGVRTAIIGLQGFFPLKGQAAAGVGSIEYPISERKRLAALSREWVCPHCQQSNHECLPDPEPSSTPEASTSAAVPEAVVECSTASPPPENAVSPIVALTSSSTPQSDIPSQEETSDEVLSMHTVNPLTPSPGPSQPDTSFPTPSASFVGRTTTDTVRTESSHSGGYSGPATRRSAHRPLLLRTLDTLIYLLLALAIAVVCKKIC
jgi:ubiquitin-conjugating enzyme E2 J1